jgi:Rod binding domain-containing protein
MNIDSLKPHVVASDIAPEKLARNPQLSEKQKIAEASRQFESILLKQILESSQKTVIKSKYSEESTASGIYHDMITSHLADSISKSGTFGLSQTFEQQLNHRSVDESKVTDKTGSPTLHHGAGQLKPLHDQTISAKTHSAAQTKNPLHERTLTKPH